MFAILSSNGNQYKVSPDKEYEIELIEGKTGDKVTFSEILLVSDKKTVVGQPFVKGASVEAEIVDESKAGDKVSVFKFHAKKRYKKTQGHRQDHTIVKILKINLSNEK